MGFSHWCQCCLSHQLLASLFPPAFLQSWGIFLFELTLPADRRGLALLCPQHIWIWAGRCFPPVPAARVRSWLWLTRTAAQPVACMEFLPAWSYLRLSEESPPKQKTVIVSADAGSLPEALGQWLRVQGCLSRSGSSTPDTPSSPGLGSHRAHTAASALYSTFWGAFVIVSVSCITDWLKY